MITELFGKCGGQIGEAAPVYKKAAELGEFPENIVFVHGTFQIFATGTSTSAYS